MTSITGRLRRSSGGLCPHLGLALALAAALPSAAFAFEVEVADEWVVDTAHTALKGHVEPSFAFDTGSGFALTVAPKPEPIRESDPERFRAIGDRGAYVDTLQFAWTGEAMTLAAGKITPDFGIAWQVAPGIYGRELGESYQLSERIGVAGQVALADGVTLSTARFFRDTSLLGRSSATEHGRLRLADGGPGNTGSPDSTSVALTLDGEDWAPGLHLHAAWLHQQAGRGDEAGQHAWVVGVAQTVELGDVAVTPVAEYAHSRDALGFAEAEAAPGTRQGLLTLALGFALDDWHAAAVWQRQQDRLTDAPVETQHAYEVSVGYLLGDGLSADIGYRLTRTAGTTTRGIATRLGYRAEF